MWEKKNRSSFEWIIWCLIISLFIYVSLYSISFYFLNVSTMRLRINNFHALILRNFFLSLLWSLLLFRHRSLLFKATIRICRNDTLHKYAWECFSTYWNIRTHSLNYSKCLISIICMCFHLIFYDIFICWHFLAYLL